MKKAILVVVMAFVGTFAFAQTRVGPQDVQNLLGTKPAPLVLDVRTPQEFSGGHLAGARLLPYDQITAESAERILGARGSSVIVYCRSGHRSGIAAQTLTKLGYRVFDLGALSQWKGPLEVGLPR